MSKKVKNWLLGCLVTVAFILGVPAIQYVFAGTGGSATKIQKASASEHASHSTQSYNAAAKVGDQYVRILPAGEESIQVILYDPELGLMAANENETTLTFSLPDGKKKTLKVAASMPSQGCSMESHSSGEDNCCPAPAENTPQEECNH